MDVDDLLDTTASPQAPSCPCIICGNSFTLQFDEDGNRIQVKGEVTTDENCDEAFSVERAPPLRVEEDCSLQGVNFKWELKLFKFFYDYLKFGGNNKAPNFVAWKKQWDLKNEPVPFCDSCKVYLRSIHVKYEELKRLQKIVSKEMKNVKEKLVESEGKFKMNGYELYNRDERYYWARYRLIGHRVVGPAFDVLKSQHNKKSGKLHGGKAQSEKKSAKTMEVSMESESFEKLVTKSTKKKKGKEDEILSAVESRFNGLSVGEENESDEDGNSHLDFPAEDVIHSFYSEDAPMSNLVPEVEKSYSPITSTPRLKRNFPPTQETEEMDYFETGSKRSRRSVASKPIFYKDDVDNWDSDLDIEKPPRETPLPPKRPNRTSKKRPPPRTQDDNDEDFDIDEFEKTEKDMKGNRSKPEKKSWKKFKPVFEEGRGQYRYLMTYFDKTGKNHFKCTQCNLVLNAISSIKSHTINQHLTVHCPWPYCNFVGRSKPTTEKHFMATHDEIQSKKHCCDICGCPMLKIDHLKYHRLTHLNAEEREAFEKSGGLPPHMMKVPCAKCGKLYLKWQLKQHEEHCGIEVTKGNDSEEERPYLCAQCGKSFKLKSYLNTHVKLTHPDPNAWRSLPFACVYPGCEKRFTREKELKAHKAVHRVDRVHEFYCTLCPKKFSQKKSYDNHQLLHRNEKPFECSVENCKMSFTYPGSLTKHIKTSHRDEEDGTGSRSKAKISPKESSMGQEQR